MSTYYLNSRGTRYTTIPKEKALVFHGAARYCKKRTIEYWESFGNFALACLRYNGKMIKVLPEYINGEMVLFVDYKEKYQ